MNTKTQPTTPSPEFPKTLSQTQTIAVTSPEAEAEARASGFVDDAKTSVVPARPTLLGDPNHPYARFGGKSPVAPLVHDSTHPFHLFPIHFHHKTKPPVVAYDSETRDNAIADGYTTDYIHQDYPKVVHAEVADAGHAKEAAAHGFVFGGDPNAPFPRTVSRTFASAAEEEGAAPKDPKEPKSFKDEFHDGATPTPPSLKQKIQVDVDKIVHDVGEGLGN